MRKICMALCGALLSLIPATAKVENLLPPVKHLNVNGRVFRTDRNIKVESSISSSHFSSLLSESGINATETGNAVVILELVDSIPGCYDYELAAYPAEGYSLSVGNDTINIKGMNRIGLLRGLQTLDQLAQGSNGRIEGVEITDWPAFKLRGWMHDLGRSYMSVSEIKRQIDFLSKFKVNTFHWHLTENQAFRMESLKYPKLNAAENMSRHAGMYYTMDEMRDIERFASERGIMVIPELDMPGHSDAFTKAMGHDMQTDEGVNELMDLIEEVCEAFPEAPYIHIGADEKKITYPDFLKIMIDKVHSMGGKVAVWNPIHGVKVTKEMDVDLVTLWSTAGRLVEGVPNVDLRYNYANHFDVFSDLIGIYLSNIYYSDKGSPELAGTISAYWNDRKMPSEKDIVIQNNLYANILASAERAWKGGGKEYIEQRGVVLPYHGEEFQEFADFERRFLYHKEYTLPFEEIPYVKQTNIKWHLVGPYNNYGDSSMRFAPEDSTDNLPDSIIIEATGAAPMLRHYWGSIIPAYFTNPQLNTTAYGYTYIYSPTEQEAGALIEFQNYSRSEKDVDPKTGNWDCKGSKIWLNDEEIPAPTWFNTDIEINNEIELRNENFSARAPIPVKLNQGWNKVLVKLPYVQTDGVRLNKWMFTFVLTDKTGRHALENIIYSPTK